MSSNTPAPVIVVTEDKKRRKALLWVAGGAALLLGGSTFALWSAQADFSGGTITAGDLDIAQTADTTFWDVSSDRSDATGTVTGTDGSQLGHSLDPTDASSWLIVPGDKVAASFSSNVTLDGDNLVAELALVQGTNDFTANPDITWTYEVYQAGQLIVSETALPTDADSPLMYLSANPNGQDNGDEDATTGVTFPIAGGAAQTTVVPMTDSTEDFTVVVYGTFNDVNDATDQGAADTLGGLQLTLEQVRTSGVGLFN